MKELYLTIIGIGFFFVCPIIIIIGLYNINFGLGLIGYGAWSMYLLSLELRSLDKDNKENK